MDRGRRTWWVVAAALVAGCARSVAPVVGYAAPTPRPRLALQAVGRAARARELIEIVAHDVWKRQEWRQNGVASLRWRLLDLHFACRDQVAYQEDLRRLAARAADEEDFWSEAAYGLAVRDEVATTRQILRQRLGQVVAREPVSLDRVLALAPLIGAQDVVRPALTRHRRWLQASATSSPERRLLALRIAVQQGDLAAVREIIPALPPDRARASLLDLERAWFCPPEIRPALRRLSDTGEGRKVEGAGGNSQSSRRDFGAGRGIAVSPQNGPAYLRSPFSVAFRRLRSDPAAARRSAERALERVRRLRGARRDAAFLQAVGFFLAASDPDRARGINAAVRNPAARIRGHAAIARRLIQSGERVQALAQVDMARFLQRSIATPGEFLHGAVLLAPLLAELGDRPNGLRLLDEARREVDHLMAAELRASAWIDLAAAQIRFRGGDDAPLALRDAERAVEEAGRTWGLMGRLAQVQCLAGDFDAALETARLADSDLAFSWTLMEIATSILAPRWPEEIQPLVG